MQNLYLKNNVAKLGLKQTTAFHFRSSNTVTDGLAYSVITIYSSNFVQKINYTHSYNTVKNVTKTTVLQL